MCWRFIKGRNDAHNFTGTVAEVWAELVKHNTLGYAIYAVVNEGGQDGGSIEKIRSNYIDADGVPFPERWHIKPSFFVIRDALHWHAYWRVDDCSVEAFETAQRRLIAHYGAQLGIADSKAKPPVPGIDPAIHDLPRIMRVPGSVHLKGEPILVHFEYMDPRIKADPARQRFPSWPVYKLDELMAGLPPPYEKPKRAQAPGAAPEEGTFFRRVNTAALADIAAWASELFPEATQSGDAWRVSSASLGRDLEEDISIHPDGIQDFGEEAPRTAIDLVMTYGEMELLPAALWLCERLGIEPVELGYGANPNDDGKIPEQWTKIADYMPPGKKKDGRQYYEGLTWRFAADVEAEQIS
jgi:hypothetical protein